MKKFLVFILLFSMNAQAVCDWKTIVANPDKTFTYSEACHLSVGDLVQANKDLTSAVQLKDLALSKADERTTLWKTTSESEQDRMLKIQSDQNKSLWLMFGLGALTVIGSGWMASRLLHP